MEQIAKFNTELFPLWWIEWYPFHISSKGKEFDNKKK
jgi:hypothetical protein